MLGLGILLTKDLEKPNSLLNRVIKDKTGFDFSRKEEEGLVDKNPIILKNEKEHENTKSDVKKVMPRGRLTSQTLVKQKGEGSIAQEFERGSNERKRGAFKG